MFDIHNHILPNVDDGSKSIEESLLMIDMLYQQGIKKIVLTPHVQNSVQKVSSKLFPEKFNAFKDIVKSHNPDIELYLGYEVRYDPSKNTDYEKFVFQGFSQKYLLIEFSTKIEEPIVDIMYNLKAKGFQPILAHPERYIYINEKDIARMKQDGILIQVNANAVLGIDGRIYKKRALKFLKLQLVDFIATDAHNSTDRKPNLGLALKKVSKIFSNKEL